MKVLIVEPFLGGSHASWAEGYATNSRHDTEVIGLQGRHWKWRMHGGAVTLARRFLSKSFEPDLIVASDMLDLAAFLALARGKAAGVKTAVYFHENQFAYPSPGPGVRVDAKRDAHFGFINFTSALAADRVLFNSMYNLDSFFDGLLKFLSVLPDHRETGEAERIRDKSSVLPLGIDLCKFDRYSKRGTGSNRPLVLWNHRWEYDKNPDEFFRALFVLQEKGIDFEVAVLGREFAVKPDIFEEAGSKLGARIVRFGFENKFEEYASCLWEADILPVTSIHDFFGVSVVEAVYCGCWPLLPLRLAYPEHISPVEHPGCFYDGFDELVDKLANRIIDIEETRAQSPGKLVNRYDWKEMAPIYDELFEGLVDSGDQGRV